MVASYETKLNLMIIEINHDVYEAAIIPAHEQTVAPSIYGVLKSYYGGNQGRREVMMAAMFSVSEVVSMCYSSDLSLLVDGSSCDKGKEGHAFQRTRVRAPEGVEALSGAVTSEPVASNSSSTSVDMLFVSADVYQCRGRTVPRCVVNVDVKLRLERLAWEEV